MKTDFEKLVASVVSGDHQAFRVFYDLYYLKIYRFVYRFLQNPHDCESVVSDVFCLVWEKRRLLEQVKNMDAYMYRISRNESFHFLKKKNNDQCISLNDILPDVALNTASVIDVMTENEMMQVYQSAVNKLPERCRTVFLMVREQKLSHKEVSEIMGITPGTIEVQINIAIKKITNTIKNYYPKLMASEWR